MAEVQNSPRDALHAGKHVSQEKDVLIEELDALLERYLRTLDEYDQARLQLASQLSSGYMSLAQANFHNSSSAVRFGQDCYDERMQAIRKVNVIEDQSSSNEKHSFSVVSSNRKAQSKEEVDASVGEKNDEAEEAQSTKSQPANDPEAKDNADPDAGNEEQSSKESDSSSEKLIDPIRWFGILVPPALRQAQSSFVSAIEGPIPQLTTLLRDLRSQEIDIGRVRKQIRKLNDNL